MILAALPVLSLAHVLPRSQVPALMSLTHDEEGGKIQRAWTTVPTDKKWVKLEDLKWYKTRDGAAYSHTEAMKIVTNTINHVWVTPKGDTNQKLKCEAYAANGNVYGYITPKAIGDFNPGIHIKDLLCFLDS